RHHPLALAPHARSVRPPVLTVAVVEDAHPARATPIAQSVEVVHDLEQAAATRTTVDGLSDRPRTRAARKAAKLGGVRHGGTILGRLRKSIRPDRFASSSPDAVLALGR